MSNADDLFLSCMYMNELINCFFSCSLSHFYHYSIDYLIHLRIEKKTSYLTQIENERPQLYVNLHKKSFSRTIFVQNISSHHFDFGAFHFIQSFFYIIVLQHMIAYVQHKNNLFTLKNKLYKF